MNKNEKNILKNGNIICQTLCYESDKAVNIKTFMVLHTYIKKKEKSQIENQIFHCRLEKE